jgi:hypothetical protein
LNKSTKNMEVNPSKVKIVVREIPEESKYHSTTKGKKKSKKDDKKLEEFMKVYGL